MKKGTVLGCVIMLLIILLYIVGVWLSGWEPHRCQEAVAIYFTGIMLAGVGYPIGELIAMQ